MSTYGKQHPRRVRDNDLSISAKQHERRRKRSQRNALPSKELQQPSISQMDLSFFEKKEYQNALDFLIANGPEQRLDTRLPFTCFLALQEEAHKRYHEESNNSTSSYPRVEYSSKDSTATIITCQSSLHANAAQFLQEWIVNGARTELTNQGRDGLGNRWRPLFDETCNARNDDESSEFRYPRRQDMNVFSVANDLNPFHDAIVEVGRNQPFGPYPYRGHNWFGSLESAFIEIFRRDPLTGMVNQFPRIQVVENGHMVLQGGIVDVGLTIEDLLPFGQEDIEGIQQVSIGFNANLLQDYLEEGAVDTAEFRFRHAVP
ncbi:hypothetical protein V1519DRAFT_464281 [Lipomyces tetrasporus]